MAFTDNQKVRLLIGDRDEDEELLDDDEIDYALSVESDVVKAAIECCKYIIAKYSRYVDNRRSRTWERASQLVEQYKNLMRQLRTMIPVSSDSLYAGGITLSDKETYSSDTDLVKPLFKRGMHNNQVNLELEEEARDD